MKKSIFIIIGLLLVIAFASISYAKTEYKSYDDVKQSLKSVSKASDPDGKKVIYPEIVYQANKDKDPINFKKPEDIKGYVSDEDLAKKGGKYLLEKQMTYREYFNLGIGSSIRHDIDPDRMVLVFTSQFDKTHYIEGKPIEKAIVTTVYDAETGEPLSMTVKSEDPNGLDAIKKQ